MRVDIRAAVMCGTRSASGRSPTRSPPRSRHRSTDSSLPWYKREAYADLDRHPVSLMYQILRFSPIYRMPLFFCPQLWFSSWLKRRVHHLCSFQHAVFLRANRNESTHESAVRVVFGIKPFVDVPPLCVFPGVGDQQFTLDISI